MADGDDDDDGGDEDEEGGEGEGEEGGWEKKKSNNPNLTGGEKPSKTPPKYPSNMAPNSLKHPTKIPLQIS